MEKFELIKVIGGWGIENSVSGEVQSVHESLQEAMNSIDVDCWFVADGFVMEPSLGGQMVEEEWGDGGSDRWWKRREAVEEERSGGGGERRWRRR